MSTQTRSLLCVLSLGLLLDCANVNASPITWTYEGSVVHGFPSPAVPLGTPVTFTVTADPDQNILVPPVGNPFYPFMGAYYSQVFAEMDGIGYTVNAAFEVNGDPTFGGSPFNGNPIPGFTILRESSESTDHGFFISGGIPPFTIAAPSEPNTDPSSPALLMPFPTFNLVLFVAPTAGDLFAPSVNISGHLVPEPISGALLAVGFAVAALRRKLRPTRSTSN